MIYFTFYKDQLRIKLQKQLVVFFCVSNYAGYYGFQQCSYICQVN